MSALGQTQTFAVQKGMSALPPEAEMCSAMRDVRLVPIADIDLIKKAPGVSSRGVRRFIVFWVSYYFAPLWQFAWHAVIQLALRFAISHFFEHFSKHACCDFCAKAVFETKVGKIKTAIAIANVLISSVFMVVPPAVV
jgi:hypothetical protein